MTRMLFALRSRSLLEPILERLGVDHERRERRQRVAELHCSASVRLVQRRREVAAGERRRVVERDARPRRRADDHGSSGRRCQVGADADRLTRSAGRANRFRSRVGSSCWRSEPVDERREPRRAALPTSECVDRVPARAGCSYSSKYRYWTAARPDSRERPTCIHRSTAGPSAAVVSCFGFTASLNTLLSTPRFVSAIDGVNRSGPNRKRAVCATDRPLLLLRRRRVRRRRQQARSSSDGTSAATRSGARTQETQRESRWMKPGKREAETDAASEIRVEIRAESTAPIGP